MNTTIHQKYREVLDTLSFLRDVLYNTKTMEEESKQEELISQAETLVEEALTIYEKTQGVKK
jgi:hypothetical protein